jgi:hypothetical protein
MQTMKTLLLHSYPLDAPLLPTRVVRAILPTIVVLLEHGNKSRDQSAITAAPKDKKGKKRARNFEGDEIFHLGGVTICPRREDELAVLAALDCEFKSVNIFSRF